MPGVQDVEAAVEEDDGLAGGLLLEGESRAGFEIDDAVGGEIIRHGAFLSRNPKHEYRNPKQIQNPKFEFSPFEFVSDFDIRISGLVPFYFAWLLPRIHSTASPMSATMTVGSTFHSWRLYWISPKP